MSDKYEKTMEEIASLYLRCAYSTTQEEILKAFHEVDRDFCTDTLMGKLLLVALFLNPHLTPICIRTMKENDDENILSLNPALPLMLLDKADPTLAKVAEKKARVPDFSYMTVNEGHRFNFLAMDSLTKEELMAAALYAWAMRGYSDALKACLKYMGPCRELDELKFSVECSKARECLYRNVYQTEGEDVSFFSLDPRACAQEIRGIIRAHQHSKQKKITQSFGGTAQHPYDESSDVNLYGLRSVIYGYREYINDNTLNAAICDAYLYILAQEPSPRSMIEPYFPDGLKRCLLETNCKARLAMELSETTDPEAFQRISGELAKLNGIQGKS